MRLCSSFFLFVVLFASGCDLAQDLGGGTGGSLGSGSSSGHGAGMGSATASGTGGSVHASSSSGAGGTGSGGGGGSTGSTTVAATGGGAACSPSQQETIWKTMIQGPIKPGQGALLDLAGPDGKGLTLAEAQQILCQGTNLGDQLGNGTQINAWGTNEDVYLDYAPATGKGVFLTLWGPGYVGELRMTSRDGMHAFQVVVSGAQISKDGQPYQLDWDLTGGVAGPQLDAEMNELDDALLATYLPSAPADPDCQTTGACTAGTFGDIGFVFFKNVGIGVWVASVSASQPTPSTPDRIDVYPL